MTRLRTSGARRIAAALYVSTALSTVAVAAPAYAQTEDESVSAFFDGGYQYCDAKLVAALWQIDFYEAKVQLGEKILNGLGDNIPLILDEARQSGASCDWSDLAYSYEDAEALAKAWGLASVDAAKAKAARYATQGRYALIDENLSGY